MKQPPLFKNAFVQRQVPVSRVAPPPPTMRSLGTPLGAEGGVLSAQEAPPAARPESHREQTNRPLGGGGLSSWGPAVAWQPGHMPWRRLTGRCGVPFPLDTLTRPPDKESEAQRAGSEPWVTAAAVVSGSCSSGTRWAPKSCPIGSCRPFPQLPWGPRT